MFKTTESGDPMPSILLNLRLPFTSLQSSPFPDKHHMFGTVSCSIRNWSLYRLTPAPSTRDADTLTQTLASCAHRHLKTDFSTKSQEGQEAGINNALYPKISSFLSSRKKHGNDQTNYKSTGYFGDQNIDNKYKELLRNSTVWEARHFQTFRL